MSDQTGQVLIAIRDERERQDSKWGEQNHPDGLDVWWRGLGGKLEETARAQLEHDNAWVAILAEEVGEAIRARDPAALRAELVQVAAVAVAWIEAIDRRGVPK